jgi:hypothetical protein
MQSVLISNRLTCKKARKAEALECFLFARQLLPLRFLDRGLNRYARNLLFLASLNIADGDQRHLIRQALATFVRIRFSSIGQPLDRLDLSQSFLSCTAPGTALLMATMWCAPPVLVRQSIAPFPEHWPQSAFSLPPPLARRMEQAPIDKSAAAIAHARGNATTAIECEAVNDMVLPDSNIVQQMACSCYTFVIPEPILLRLSYLVPVDSKLRMSRSEWQQRGFCTIAPRYNDRVSFLRLLIL